MPKNKDGAGTMNSTQENFFCGWYFFRELLGFCRDQLFGGGEAMFLSSYDYIL